MPIKALPKTTIRLIGASQAITDPASVVKELIENALDAHATAVFIELSANSIGSILVRDNGHGIAPDDRDMVCKRYCTSKIRDYAELESVGGKSLGFRGEALASSTELSSSFSIITRVDGEDTAVTLEVGRNGDIQSRKRVSHPIGTSIRVNNLFENIPVRKQTALKNSSKCITKVRKCVQSYAFARTSVRFSLKILKARNDKDNWMYAPKPGGDIEDAALKIVGKECASQCASATVRHGEFEVQAFLPLRDAIIPRINNVGLFVFVDARPVSATRGVLKQIVSLTKDRLRTSLAGCENVKDPFMFLNIVCPPNSYDPNVEPAKDDVVFANDQDVIAVVHELLDSLYPRSTENVQDIISSSPCQLPEMRTSASDSISPISLRTETPKRSLEVDGAWAGLETISDLRPRKRQCRIKTNMCDIDDLDLATTTDENYPMNVDDEDHGAEPCSIREAGIKMTNPWIIAKMNAPLRNYGQRTCSPPLQVLSGSGANSRSSPRQLSFPTNSPRTQTSSHPTSLPPELEKPSDTPPYSGFHNIEFNEQPTLRTQRLTRSLGTSNEQNQESQSPQSNPPPTRKKVSSQRNQELLSKNCRDFASASTLSRNQFEREAQNLSPTPQQASRNRGTRTRKGPSQRKSTRDPFVSSLRQDDLNQNHTYMRSSPPTLPADYGFTPINRYYPPQQNGANGTNSSLDVQNFLSRIKSIDTNRKHNGRYNDQVWADEQESEAAGCDRNSEEFIAGTFSASHGTARDLSSTTQHDPIEPPGWFSPPAHTPATRTSFVDQGLSELQKLVCTLRITVEALAQLTSKLEHLNIREPALSTGGDHNDEMCPEAIATVSVDSTFTRDPPETEEVEEWRRQLVRFVQQTCNREKGADMDLDVDIEGALAAAAAYDEYEGAFSEDVSQGRSGEMVCGSSQGSDMLVA